MVPGICNDYVKASSSLLYTIHILVRECRPILTVIQPPQFCAKSCCICYIWEEHIFSEPSPTLPGNLRHECECTWTWRAYGQRQTVYIPMYQRAHCLTLQSTITTTVWLQTLWSAEEGWIIQRQLRSTGPHTMVGEELEGGVKQITAAKTCSSSC